MGLKDVPILTLGCVLLVPAPEDGTSCGNLVAVGGVLLRSGRV